MHIVTSLFIIIPFNGLLWLHDMHILVTVTQGCHVFLDYVNAH